MKYINKILVGLFAAGMLAGCSESFLEKEPTKDMTPDQIADAAKQNPNVGNALLAGVYTLTFDSGTGGTSGHTDFGQKSIDITTDMISGDMALKSNSYNKFQEVSQMIGHLRTTTRSYMLWRYYYRIIKSANDIIDSFGGDAKIPTDEEAVKLWGQAMGLRGYAYFYLANLYTNLERADMPCVPVYRTAKTNVASSKSTLKEVLTQAESDLQNAVTALDGFTRANSSQLDKDVAKAYLAYTKLTLGVIGDATKFAEAATVSQSVLDTWSSKLMTKEQITESGFNSVDNVQGWMWAFDITKANTNKLVTFWSHIDIYTYGYAYIGNYKMIDEGLYASIPATDARKAQFGANLAPTGKFYDAARTNGADKTWENDIFFLRVADVLLVNAEANARAGATAAAQASLKILLDERDTNSAALLAKAGQDLLNEIDKQIRIESWGEGKSLLAMKRFKRSHTRGSNHLDYPGVTYSWDSEETTIQIPDNEELNNPNL